MGHLFARSGRSTRPISSRGMFDRAGNALPVLRVFDQDNEVAADQPGVE
jgi:hypothetical protein